MSYSDLLRKVIANQVPESFLLDEYSGAVGAYSLRYLSSSYTDDVILVRRSSDDAEEGFTPTEITDGTLESFCGAGGGFVKTWYDQTGNNNDATQTTLGEQPQIVNSGSLIIDNGNPSILFNNDRLLTPPYITGTSARSFFIVHNQSNAGNSPGQRALLSLTNTGGSSGNGRGYRISKENGNLFLRVNQASSWDYPSGITATTYAIITNIWDGGGSQDADFWLNSIQLSYNSGTSVNLDTVDTGGHIIGWYDPSNFFYPGTMQEIIIYPIDQTSNRLQIENNQNDYYGVF